MVAPAYEWRLAGWLSARRARVALANGFQVSWEDEVDLFDESAREDFIEECVRTNPGLEASREKLRQALDELAADAEWPEPMPLTSAEDCPSFPLDEAFASAPAAIKDYLRAIAECYQVPVELPAMLLLPIVGATLATKVELEVTPGWTEVPAVWVLVLMPSGSRKSPVLAELTRPVTAWEREEAERLAPEIIRSQQEAVVRDRRMKRIRDQLVNSPSDHGLRDDLERLIAEAASTRPVTAPQLIVTEPTVEALAAQLQRNGERALLASAEADAIDVALGRYSDGRPNLGALLSGYTGEVVRISRKSGDVHLERPVLNVGLAVQPEAVRDLLEHRQARGRGFLARFFYSLPEDLVGYRDLRQRPIPESLGRLYAGGIRKLLQVPHKARPAIVKLSEGAAVALQEFREVHEPRMRAGSDLGSRREWANKEVGGLARIALILEALGGFVGSVAFVPREVSEASMRAALAWASYLEQHQLAAEGLLGMNEEVVVSQKILDWIKEKSIETFSKRECHRSTRGGGVSKSSDLDRPLELLEENYWIRKLDSLSHSSKPGRPSGPRYAVNPRLLGHIATTLF